MHGDPSRLNPSNSNIRQMIQSGQENRLIREQDEANAARSQRERTAMSRTPQNDLSAVDIDTASVDAELDDLYTEAVEVLDEIATAAQREATLDATRAATTAQRFPAVGDRS